MINFQKQYMRQFIKYFIICSLLALSVISCKKDGPQLTITDKPAFSAGLAASVQSLTITPDHDNDTVVVFTWPAVNYGGSSVVTYTFQFDTPADTAGTGAWGKAQTFNAGNNVLQYGFTGKNLNNLLNAMGVPAGTSNSLVFRVISNVTQYNGSVSAVKPAYSQTLALDITPYALSLYVPGAYQGWDPTSAPLLNPVAGSPGLFEGYYNITGSGQQYFKYTNAPDWNHTNYGDGGNNTFSTDGNAAGLSVPDGGYYELTADLNKNTWTATKTTWAIIGDATPGGWDNETEMTYDATNQVWTLVAVMKQAGSFKFRANNAWSIDFGIDGNGHLQYADNPFFPYNSTLNNLTVPADGTYTITLDLHVSGKYNFSLVKN